MCGTLLQILENAVTDCQTQIGAAVNTAAPDHLRYSAAVDTLAAEIEAIKSDIARLQDAAADSAAVTPLNPKITLCVFNIGFSPACAVQKKLRAGGGPRAGGGIDPDLTSLTVRLNALQKLAALLESVLQVSSENCSMRANKRCCASLERDTHSMKNERLN